MQGLRLFPCLQVAHADAAWRINLCEQYFVIWDKLQQPDLTQEQVRSLRVRLEKKAQETQSRSATFVPACVGAVMPFFTHPFLHSIIHSFNVSSSIPSFGA